MTSSHDDIGARISSKLHELTVVFFRHQTNGSTWQSFLREKTPMKNPCICPSLQPEGSCGIEGAKLDPGVFTELKRQGWDMRGAEEAGIC